jgi:acyl-coenzyme A thioesterase PaaI-like protein
LYFGFDPLPAYHRPVSIATKPLRCEGSVIHKGTMTAVAEARMLDGDDPLYAHAISTCLIFHETKDKIATRL